MSGVARRTAELTARHRRVLWDNHAAPITHPVAHLDANHAAAEWARHHKDTHHA